jgi:hypothetical protein
MLETTLKFALITIVVVLIFEYLFLLVKFCMTIGFAFFHFLDKGNIPYLFFYGWNLYENGCMFRGRWHVPFSCEIKQAT